MTYSLTLRNEKGSVLTIDEMDNNFKYLDSKSSTSGTSNIFPITARPGDYTAREGDYKIVIDTLEQQEPLTVTIPNSVDVVNGTSYKIHNVEYDGTGTYSVTIVTQGGTHIGEILNGETIEVTSLNGIWYMI